VRDPRTHGLVILVVSGPLEGAADLGHAVEAIAAAGFLDRVAEPPDRGEIARPKVDLERRHVAAAVREEIRDERTDVVIGPDADGVRHHVPITTWS
jgi:hypothetical protein